jgi:hypothetical protein
VRLPVFHGEPATSVVAVMLFPNDLPLAETLAARILASGPIQKISAPLPLAPEFLAVLGRKVSTEDDQQFTKGVIVGEIVKTLWALINTSPTVASWAAAIEVVEGVASDHNVQTGQHRLNARSTYQKYLHEFRPALHLWGAFSLGGRRWPSDYTIFFAQAMALLGELKKWAIGRPAESLNLSGDFYSPPAELVPAEWPLSFPLPIPTLSTDRVPTRRRRGRPRNPSDAA